MRAFLKSIVLCLLCLALLIPSACAPQGANPTEPLTTPALPTPTGPLTTPTLEPTPTNELPTDEPVTPGEPTLDIDPIPVPDGDIPAVHPDEETELYYNLDGLSGKVAAVEHCNIHGYSIVYDALHYERRSYEGSDSYWSEDGLYISISLFFDCTIDFIMDGLMLQENIEMVPHATVVGAQNYPAYTLWKTTEDGIYREFRVLDYKGSALLIEQSYPTDHEFVDFHRAVQQAMLDSIVLVEHNTAAIDTLQAVLKWGQTVVLAEDGDTVTLQEHLARRSIEAGQDMEYIAYCYCDLDHDGTVEMVLCHTIGDVDAWFDILRFDGETGTVYLYERTFRGLLHLKTDGTFEYSNGADNSGIATLYFDGMQAITAPFVHMESENGIDIRYYVEFEAVDAEAFAAALEVQNGKNSVLWYAMDNAE